MKGKICRRLFTPPKKREIGHFHVRRAVTAKNVQESMMHVQSCYFAYYL